VWRDNTPGALGSAKTLAQVTGGSATPTESVVANHFDDHAISHIFVYDASGPSWSSNQAGVTTEWSLFPASPAVGDIIYYGSDNPFFNLTHNIQQIEVSTGVTYVWEYSNGAAGWPDQVLGNDTTLYPYTDFKTAGTMAVNFKGNSAWAVETVNAVANKFWLRCRISAIATSYTTPPSNKDYAVYNQRAPHIAIPSATVIGDGPPLCLLRMKAPYGGDADVYFSNTSRVLIGRKSRNLSSFSSHLNCGNDGMPSGWAATYGTDAAAAADPEAPGGDRANVTFATNATLIKRVTLTGTDLAAAFVGEYRPFLRVAQIGGTAGDCTVRLRVVLDSTATYATGISGPEITLKGVSTDGGYFELVDMWPNESLSIPFSRFLNADSLTGADLIFEVYASRSTGSSTLRIYDLILLPVDEWAAELDDPVTDITTGSSALRGLTILDDDGGLIWDRTLKSVLSAAGGTAWPAETWSRHGLPLKLDPAKDQRLYFVMCHYPEGENWQTPPLCARPGMMLVVQLYSHNIYLEGRGAT
jgi:hypothetical protein